MAKREHRLGGGLNLKGGTDVIADDELVVATGCRFDEFGVVTSEPGRNLVATVANSGSDAGSRMDTFRGITEYYLDGVWYLATQDTHAWQQFLYASPYTEASLTALSPSFKPMTGVMFNGIAYLTNGFTLRRVIRQAASATVAAGGTGYNVGDTISTTGGSFAEETTDAVPNKTVWQVDTVSGTAIATVSVVSGSEGRYTETPTNPATATTVTGGGSGATLTVTYQSALERVGLSAPGNAPRGTYNAGAGGSQIDTYKWVYTFYNGICESNFSPEGTLTFATASKQADISGITAAAGNDAAAFTRRLYRTDRGGSSFFFITEIADNSTNAFTDAIGLVDADSEATTGDDITNEQRREDKKRLNAAIKEAKRAAKKAHEKFDKSAFLETYYSDLRTSRGEIIQTNLGILAEWTDHNPPLSGAAGGIRTLKVLGDFVFGINFNNTLVFSHLNNPEQWSKYDRVRIGRDYGDELVTIEPLGFDMICFTKLGMWKFRRLGADATNSTLESIVSPTGCESEEGVAATDRFGLIFMGNDGIYRYDGRDVTKISEAIEDIFNNSSHADYAHPDGRETVTMATKEDKVWISYYAGSSYTAGTNFNNRTILLDFQEGRPKYSISSMGFGSLFRGHDGTIWGGDENNKLYHVDVSDGSTAITWTVQTKYFPISAEFAGDMPEKIYVDADFGNVSTTITLLGDEDETVMTWTVSSSNGRVKHEKLVPLGKIYDRLAIKITSSGNATRRVYGVGFITDDGRME